jgi:hypothetical protein
MKNLCLLVAVLVCVLIGSSVEAAILGYDPQSSDMPASPWVMGGATNPIATFFGTGGVAGLNVSGSDKGYWYYNSAGLSSSGYTVDINCIPDSDTGSGFPIVVNLYDSGELYQVKIGKQEGVVIQQEGSGALRGSAAVTTGDAYHTYRVVRSGQSITVYMDSNASPIISASLLDNNALPGYDRVLFGRGDSSAAGTAGLDYILWNNSTAIMGAPDLVALPEPATISLIVLGIACLRRRV